ncbi:hypothetical protein [Kitasatospora sp. NBC_01539]|uniref:hypothetical protein n=1 Tax=Kitasatospora sp. NBC_01539 TaxID=2903577 RepID=UPI0038602B4C
MHDVEVQHAVFGQQRDAPVALPVGVARPVLGGADALAEVVAAAARIDQAEVPRTDGQFAFALPLQEGGQLRDKAGVRLTEEGVVRRHEERLAGPGLRSYGVVGP